jgi:hypothetical protein
MNDLKQARRYFDDVKLQFFHLSSLAAVPFRNTPAFAPIHEQLAKFDDWLFRRLPFTQRYAWMVLMILRHPIKQPASKTTIQPDQIR